MKKIGKAAVLSAIVFMAFLGCQRGAPAARGQNQDMENFNPTGLPIVNKMETFTLLVDSEDDPVTTMVPVFEEQTNVRVDATVYPGRIALERKNILLASGDYPDVIAGWLLSQAEVIRLKDEETIIGLSEMIDKYTVNIKEALGLPGVREAMTHPDGEIYTIPYINPAPLVSFNPWINVEWLQRLGLPMPTTTGEFKNTLAAFRDRIPPVNGQSIIPFTARPGWAMGTLAGWFGVDATGFFEMVNGQLEISVTKPQFQEFIKYFADLYANRLIDQELFSQDISTWVAKGRQGLYGVSFNYYPADFAPQVREDVTVNQYDYEALPVLRGPGVEKPVFRRASEGFQIFRTQAVITDKATNPLTIIRWFDNLYEEANSLSYIWGPLGIRFEKLEDGTFRETANGRSPQAIEAAGQPFWTPMPRFIRPGRRAIAPPEGEKPEYRPTEVRDALYEPYLNELTPVAWPDLDLSQQMNQINQALTYYHNQKIAEWVTGQANIDSEWDAYIANLERLRINELLDLNRGLIGQ